MSENKDLRILKERRSIRSYDSRPIDDDILFKILDATRWCWSAVNPAGDIPKPRPRKPLDKIVKYFD